MANRPKAMVHIRSILQLLTQGHSKRHVARILDISRNTVDGYCSSIVQCGHTFSSAMALDDDELGSVVYKKQVQVRQLERFEGLAPDLKMLVGELSKRGVTRLLLWHEYKAKNPSGYGYSQFCELIRNYQAVNSSVMYLEHKPGDTMQIDFAGGKLSYVDEHGQVILCPVLVAVFPYSQYTYAEALHDMTQASLLPCLGRALAFFGGVPKQVLSDNLKQMVTKSDRYEPVFNDLALEWSLHYKTALESTRVAKPRDKATVEKAVDLVYKHVFAPLRNKVFRSLSELNEQVMYMLEIHNTARFQKKPFSRKECFYSNEVELLGELPKGNYQIKYRQSAKVQKNYHVVLGKDRHQYSVPYRYVGEQVSIVFDLDTVEIYLGLERIACHKRSYKEMAYSTLDSHMPEKHLRHKQARGWDAEYFIKKAETIGPSFKAAVSQVLSERTFTEQTYNTCLGMLALERKYGLERLEKASGLLLQTGKVNYLLLKNVLLKNRDKADTATTANIPHHENIRGNYG